MIAHFVVYFVLGAKVITEGCKGHYVVYFVLGAKVIMEERMTVTYHLITNLQRSVK